MLEAQKTDPVADWEAQRELRLKSIEQEYLGLIRRQKDLEQRLTDRKLDVQGRQFEYDRVEEMVLAADEHREQRKTEAGKGTDFYRTHVCPTCGSAIGGTLHGAIEVVVQVKAQLKECLLALSDAQTSVRQTERDIAAIDKTLDQLESRSEGIEKEVNPYADRAHRDREFLADLHSQIYSLEQEQRKAEEEESLASSWATWFKEIRLGLISEALDQLELEVNSCITRLGLQDWTLLFDVDKETKSGTLSRGFSVSVLSPHNDKAVPWEAWSGGESQRLRLAANMGLSNLIRQRTNSPLALEVWDEPTQWLSPQGVQDLMEALEQRAEDEHRQIWVLDHRTLGFSGFRGQVGAIKTKEHGTRFDLSGLCLKGSADAPTDANPNGAAAPPELRRRARTA
jgi:DNA repair exonuclease SbcCD ATPase subunit